MTKSKLLAIALTGALLAPISVALVATPANAQSVQSIVRNFEESKAGQFCKKADLGKKKRADNGTRIKCKKVNGRARWVRA